MRALILSLAGTVLGYVVSRYFDALLSLDDRAERAARATRNVLDPAEVQREVTL